MSLIRRIGPILALLLLVGACATHPRAPGAPAAAGDPVRKDASTPAKAPPAPHYLAPAHFNLLAVLPAPPANDSPLTRAEIELVLAVQRGATPETVARAKADEDMTPLIFADVLGPSFNDKALPRTFAFLKGSTADASTIYNGAKDHFKRARPPTIDRRVNPHEEPSPSFGYPSGNATRGMLWGTLLAECLPERRDALRARAGAAAHSRVVLGVHFPSDVAAGMAGGEAIAGAIIASPRARADLDAARAELRAAFPGKP